MYCTVCGQQADEENTYCPTCGAPLKTTTDYEEAEAAYATQCRNLVTEHELKGLREKWRNCLVAGCIFGIAAGCFIGWAGIAYPPSGTPPVALLVLVALAGGFFFPFGLTIAKDFFTARGVSKVLFWLIVLIFTSITFPACSIVGIPGIVLMRRKIAQAERATTN